jgi:hypothetical protein
MKLEVTCMNVLRGSKNGMTWLAHWGAGRESLLMKNRLQNKVIDLEVANGTPSPTVDPSVRTILVGHSMG